MNRDIENRYADARESAANQAYSSGLGAAQTYSTMGLQANQQANLQAGTTNLQAQQEAQRQQEASRQFGANLGLQGYNQAGQLAGQLGQLGQQEYSQEMGRIQAMSDLGAKEQAQEQAVINQQLQNYATQQQYPFMQLGIMSNMLRGLPMQAGTTSMYQAQPMGIQQAVGMAGALSSMGRKEGGVIKGYKEGGVTKGIPGYKSGVLVGLEDDIDNIAQMDSYAPPMQRQLPKLTQQTSICLSAFSLFAEAVSVSFVVRVAVASSATFIISAAFCPVGSTLFAASTSFLNLSASVGLIIAPISAARILALFLSLAISCSTVSFFSSKTAFLSSCSAFCLNSAAFSLAVNVLSQACSASVITAIKLS